MRFVNPLLMLLLAILNDCGCKRMWEHELLEAHVYSSDESKVKLNLYVNRVGRDLVGFSGTVDWNFDADNEAMFELGFYRSANGNDYRPMPFSISNKYFKDYKTLYDDIIYINLKDCSNLPQIEGDYLIPWPRNLYTFNNCNFHKGVLPEVVAEGTYKTVFAFFGEVNWNVTFIFYVRPKLL
ncbi:uncharacterized protein LOC6581360 [Drosophila mojavensis]|uniref:uncharacterized protein LOC6581360 n=1 Tax=Drosophila mojavensis TaxID=7230 RepID=UPI00017C9B16|nr:uncharacterized protein LOC6581360 [Drosophila mojavensis]